MRRRLSTTSVTFRTCPSTTRRKWRPRLAVALRHSGSPTDTSRRTSLMDRILRWALHCRSTRRPSPISRRLSNSLADSSLSTLASARRNCASSSTRAESERCSVTDSLVGCSCSCDLYLYVDDDYMYPLDHCTLRLSRRRYDTQILRSTSPCQIRHSMIPQLCLQGLRRR